MTAITYYDASFAIEGGPGPSTDAPTIDPNEIIDETSGSVSILFAATRGMFVVVDATGRVLAESTQPSELLDWITEYLEAYDDLEVEQGA